MPESERLLLGPPTLDDVGFATAYLSDPEAMRFLGGRTAPPEAWPRIVQGWLDRWEQSGLGYVIWAHR